eukprot:12122623-Heterocapsa_arctica.AAC.1
MRTGHQGRTHLDNVSDCRRSLLEGLSRHTDVMISDEQTTLCGYSDVNKSCAGALRGTIARVLIMLG